MSGDPIGSGMRDGIFLSVLWEQCGIRNGNHFPPVSRGITSYTCTDETIKMWVGSYNQGESSYFKTETLCVTV